MSLLDALKAFEHVQESRATGNRIYSEASLEDKLDILNKYEPVFLLMKYLKNAFPNSISIDVFNNPAISIDVFDNPEKKLAIVIYPTPLASRRDEKHSHDLKEHDRPSLHLFFDTDGVKVLNSNYRGSNHTVGNNYAVIDCIRSFFSQSLNEEYFKAINGILESVMKPFEDKYNIVPISATRVDPDDSFFKAVCAVLSPKPSPSPVESDSNSPSPKF
jgi:hypothetical protein